MSKKTDKLTHEMRVEELQVNTKLHLRETINNMPSMITGILGVVNDKLTNKDLLEITNNFSFALKQPTFLTQTTSKGIVKIISFQNDSKAELLMSLNTDSSFDREILETLSQISKLNKVLKEATTEDIREIKKETNDLLTRLNDYMNDYLLTAQSDLQYSKKFVVVSDLEDQMVQLKKELKLAKKKKEDTTDIETKISNTKEKLKGYGVTVFDKFERGLGKLANEIL